ncbi:MAG TPA: type III polyketide synthase [Alphaproteobacteria bacterium]|nr:type III polyketide synthase [Alphaproteobacteria bacterium]
MADAYINRIGTAVPPHDCHDKFVDYAPSLLTEPRLRRLFGRMAERAQIEHRWSFFEPHADPAKLDAGDFYRRGAFPDTAARMRFYERHAPGLAAAALEAAGIGQWGRGVTHLIVVSCTGFYAPGLDLQIVQQFGLDPGVERTMIGFMGCYAAMNALKLARHIVRAEPAAKVAVVCLELCTLHMQETADLEALLSFLIFADGCAAALVSAEPQGIRLDGFASAVMPESAGLITWHIGECGFDMFLSGQVPNAIGHGLPDAAPALLGGRRRDEVALWAIHPGGRTVLDAVETALALPPDALDRSRAVLRDYGNMSSATVMFVLKAMLEDAAAAGPGCAMAFGPGLTAEAMAFTKP